MSVQNHAIFISSESCYSGYVLYTGRWIRLNRTHQSPYLEKLAQQRLVTRLRTIDNISITSIATVCSYQSIPTFHSLLQNINIHLTYQPPAPTLTFHVQDHTKLRIAMLYHTATYTPLPYPRHDIYITVELWQYNTFVKQELGIPIIWYYTNL